MLRILLLLIVLALSGAASAQQTGQAAAQPAEPFEPAGVGPPKAVIGEQSVLDFRPVGETRIWSFFAKQQTFGRLTSTVTGTREIDGREAASIHHLLQIDYNRIGTDRQIQMAGTTWVAVDGPYLGTQLTMTMDGTTESLRFERDGDEISGYFTRADQQVEQSAEIPVDRFAWDKDFIDQLEIYLAMHDINVGDTLVDTLVVPRTMTRVPLKGVVKWWMWQEIYKGFIDSVYIIRFTEPQEYQAYFSDDKKLVRLDMINQEIRVYQDAVQPPGKNPIAEALSEVQAPAYGWRNFLFGLPHYVAYLVIALLTAMFLGKRVYRWVDAYIAFVIGAIGFVIVPVTQIPLQEYLISDWLIPGITKGGSIYLWAAAPALAGGIVQVLVVTGLLYLIFEWRNPKARRYGALGVCLGAAFGFVESSYLLGTSITPLFSWLLFERMFWIICHASIGGLIGLGIFRGRGHVTAMIILGLVVQVWLRYLPVFVQEQVMDVPLARIVVAFTGLVVLVYTLFALASERDGKRVAEGA